MITEPHIGKPALPSAIGQITMNWAALEFSLALIMAELIETDHSTAIFMSAALDYRHRRDLITSLAEVKLKHDHNAMTHLAKYMADVKGMNKERNLAVHSMWGIDPNTKRITMVTMRNHGAVDMKMKPIAPGHLKSIAEKIAKLSNEGTSISIMIRASVKAWRKKHPAPLPPHLAHEAHHQESNQCKPLDQTESSQA